MDAEDRSGCPRESMRGRRARRKGRRRRGTGDWWIVGRSSGRTRVLCAGVLARHRRVGRERYSVFPPSGAASALCLASRPAPAHPLPTNRNLPVPRPLVFSPRARHCPKAGRAPLRPRTPATPHPRRGSLSAELSPAAWVGRLGRPQSAAIRVGCHIANLSPSIAPRIQSRHLPSTSIDACLGCRPHSSPTSRPLQAPIAILPSHSTPPEGISLLMSGDAA